MAVNLKRSNYAYKYPFERIAAYASFAVSKYEDPSGVKALDFGFGGGRHLKLLKDLGCDVYGIDVTEDAVDTAYYHFGDQFIPREKLVIDNILEHEIYPDQTFDIVLSVGVVWALGYEKMIEFLDKIIPIIKNGGYFIANFRTKFDDLYLSENSGGGGRDSRQEAYVPGFNSYWAFLNIDELRELMESYGLCIELLERYDRYYNNEEHISYWCLAARKGGTYGETVVKDDQTDAGAASKDPAGGA